MTEVLPKKYVLGVDGGGTKTKAWIAAAISDSGTLRLEIVGRGQSGASNPRSVGFERSFAELETAIAQARSQAGPIPQLHAACLSLAGAGRPQEQESLIAWANKMQLAQQLRVCDDVEPIAMAAEYEEQLTAECKLHANWEQSITLISGTGSIACGKNRHGQRVRAGGWGYLLGDAGSGFAIGLAALQAICNAHDGTGPKTQLADALLNQLEFSSVQELVGFVYRNPTPKDEVARLADRVIACSETDEVAARIVRASSHALSQLLAAVAQQLGIKNQGYSLALSGGVLSHHPQFVREVIQQIENNGLSPRVHRLVQEPTYGPLIIASRIAHA